MKCSVLVPPPTFATATSAVAPLENLLSTYVLVAFSVGTAESELPAKVVSVENSLILALASFSCIPLVFMLSLVVPVYPPVLNSYTECAENLIV